MRLRFLVVSIFAPFVSCIAPHFAYANTLKPFSTDGCSMWPDGTPANPYKWRSCCVAHDKAYWMGGVKDLREEADRAFHTCFTKKAGVGMANYMYFMVRWAGSPLWVAPYRWGYGWGYLDSKLPRGYKQPTEEEQRQIDMLLPDTDQKITGDGLAYLVK